MLQALLDGPRATSSMAADIWRGPACRPVVAAYLGGRSLSLVCAGLHGTYLTDTVTALKLFPRTLLRRWRSRPAGSSSITRSRAKVLARGAANRRGPDPLHAAQQGRRKEDRPARLVHRRTHVLEVSERMSCPSGATVGP